MQSTLWPACFSSHTLRCVAATLRSRRSRKLCMHTIKTVAATSSAPLSRSAEFHSVAVAAMPAATVAATRRHPAALPTAFSSASAAASEDLTQLSSCYEQKGIKRLVSFPRFNAVLLTSISALPHCLFSPINTQQHQKKKQRRAALIPTRLFFSSANSSGVYRAREPRLQQKRAFFSSQLLLEQLLQRTGLKSFEEAALFSSTGDTCSHFVGSTVLQKQQRQQCLESASLLRQLVLPQQQQQREYGKGGGVAQLLANSGESSQSQPRRPVGFGNFYPSDRRTSPSSARNSEEQQQPPPQQPQQRGSDERDRGGTSGSESSSSEAGGGLHSTFSGSYLGSRPFPPAPPPPPPGGMGAIQRQIVKVLCWAGLWGFVVGIAMKGTQKQLSVQEFLSNYVARGLVERVEVIGERGDCRAIVFESPDAAATSTGDRPRSSSRFLGFALPQQQRRIIHFRTGMSPETFTEKLESFQATLGIHPRDFLPVYIEDQHEIKLLDLLASAFFFLLLLNIARDFLFSRMRRSGGGGIPPAGSSGGLGSLNRLLGASTSKRARVKPEAVKIRFADVAGMGEAKREIAEFVSFLKNPRSFQRLGAKLPKGALLVGPPGTGKTLLAKAVAGEAAVPFFSVSGSDFVEIFVGVGASRVRELFEEARKAAPSIIFIDEIDSVGGKRSTSFGNSEREQTLNQLLVEMDGFTPQQSVVVLAGTNRDDLLDDALKRPGRFDRIVQIRRPDVNERKEIFQVHIKPLKLSAAVDGAALAQRMAALTPGLVGADIANMCNEAAIQAARRRSKVGIEQVDFETAAERTVAGLPSAVKNLLSPFQRKAIAFHECGHCVAGWFLKHADPVLKLTIIPRSSGALGFSQQMPPGVDLHQKDSLLDRIAVCLGGRAAEEIFIGSVSTGAGDDIQKASRLARLLVMQFGMSEALGLVNYAMPATTPGASLSQPESFYKPYSEYTAQLIDEEVKNIIQGQYNRVKVLLKEKEKEMRNLCELLMKEESITYSDILACLGPRPVEPDAQLAAYVEALPTPRLLPSFDNEKQQHDNNIISNGNNNNEKDNNDDDSADNNNGDEGGGGGRRRDLDDNDDASVPEKVREKVRAAAAAAAARAPPQPGAAAVAGAAHSDQTAVKRAQREQ